MLFISILLSVWFVAWLVYVVFIKDIGETFMEWMDMFSEDDDSVTENVYKLKCDHCDHIWWSQTENVSFCPNCGEKIGKKKE